MSHTCQINIWNEQDWELDDGMLQAVLVRVSHHVPNASLIDIYPQERVPDDAPAYKDPGWLEWIINIKYHSGAKLTIGAIQRGYGAEYEFHS